MSGRVKDSASEIFFSGWVFISWVKDTCTSAIEELFDSSLRIHYHLWWCEAETIGPEKPFQFPSPSEWKLDKYNIFKSLYFCQFLFPFETIILNKLTQKKVHYPWNKMQLIYIYVYIYTYILILLQHNYKSNLKL